MAHILGDSDGTGTSATVSEGGSKLLLVLGMHRSGTSALTGVLQKLGAELGEELLAPTPDNPKGYFENSRIVDVHESLLHGLARGWQDPRALSAQWRETAEADKAFDGLSALVRSMASASGRAIASPTTVTARIFSRSMVATTSSTSRWSNTTERRGSTA